MQSNPSATELNPPPHRWSWGSLALECVDDLALALADPSTWPHGPLEHDGKLAMEGNVLAGWMRGCGWEISDLGPAGFVWMRSQPGTARHAPSTQDIQSLWLDLHRWGAGCDKEELGAASEAGRAGETRGRI